MTNDPVSDILFVTGARSVLTGGFRAGPSWSLRYPAPAEIKFLAIAGGGGWLLMEGQDSPLKVDVGDVLLFNKSVGFTLASDPSLQPLDAALLFQGRRGTIVSLDDDGELQHFGGHVALDPHSGWMLSSILPPVLHIGSNSTEAPTLRWLIGRLAQEGFDLKAGSLFAASHISQLLLVHIVRAHLGAVEHLQQGVLRAASDAQLSKALRVIHAQPGRKWMLAELAQAAGMSRTIFAERFREAAGTTPMMYLAQWRMLIAAYELKIGSTSIATLAEKLGYSSESAFSQAFKRTIGQPPRRFAHEQNRSDE